jgi:uncharacterized protein YutE (UPF0331/DUF86 family)
MTELWSGIERRLQRLDDSTTKLEALGERSRAEFDADSLLRDLAERNFEVAAQCVMDIAARIASLEQAPRTADGGEAIRRLAELGVLAPDFARALAPIAGFRNVLAHQYLDVDWDLVYARFARLGDLRAFAAAVRSWIARRPA